MKIPRQELESKLSLAAPALASKELMEELVQFWFTGEVVVAYNDIIGIDMPFKTDFEGGVRGSLLLGLLGKSRAKDVTVESAEDGKDLVFKAAGAKLQVALLPMAQSLWQFPEVDEKAMFRVDPDFVKMLERSMLSVGDNTSVADQLGVTIISEEGGLDFYSTDSKTITCGSMKMPKGYSAGRVILPTVFCQQFVKLCKDGGKLLLTKDSVVAQNAAGVRLWSRLVDAPRPLDFASAINTHLPNGYKKKMTPIPSRLKLAIERVVVVLTGHSGEPIEMKLDPEYLRLYAKTANAEIKDVLRLEKPHEEITALMDPELIRRALPECESMMLTERCLVMVHGDNFIHLISGFSR